MADQLLTELLVNIFLRLPPKKICQLTCVCKSWNSLVTGPYFLKAYPHQPQTNLLLFHGTSRNRKDPTPKEFFLLHHDNPAFDKYTEFTFLFKTFPKGFHHVIGCCKGVICLIDYKDTCIGLTFLWNPLINKCVVLREPPLTFNSPRPHRLALGFGFDEKSGDYKVIRIVYVGSSEIPAAVVVYRSSSGSWHNISHLGLQYEVGHKAPQAYLNGAVHWLAYDKIKNHHIVVAFDIADEVFRYIEAPDDMKFSWEKLLVQPGICEGYLTLIFQGNDGIWSGWVMKEYGIPESWTNQFSISGKNNTEIEHLLSRNNEVFFEYELRIQRLIGFRETGDVLFAMNSCDVISYHPQSGFKKLELCGPEQICSAFFASSYRESIALLGTKIMKNFNLIRGRKVMTGLLWDLRSK